MLDSYCSKILIETENETIKILEEIWGKTQSNTGASTTTKVKTEEKSAGRPEKSDDQKSAKTIANKESMS